MYENLEQLANLKIGKVSERISRENSERLSAVIRDHAQRGLSQSGLLEAAKVRSQLRTARELCQEVYRIWLEIILTVDKALTEQSVAFIAAKVLDTSISQASNIRQNLNKSLTPETTAELAGQVDREMTAIVGSVRRDLEILRREQELASPKTTPEAPHERQSRPRAIWGHVEGIVGWDGLSFAVLFPLAVGLLAMDEFSKARLAFDASAAALAIKLVLSSRKHLTNFWKIGGSAAGLGLAITLLLATNSWVSQRQTVAASRSTGTRSQTLTPLEKPSQGTEKSTSLDSVKTLRHEAPILVRMNFKESVVLTPKRRENITRTVDEFYRYLTRGIGFDLPKELPPLGVSPPKSVLSAGGQQDAPIYYSSIIIPADGIDNPDIIRTAYSTYIFETALVHPDAGALRPLNEEAAWVFFCYYPSSFTGKSVCATDAPANKWRAALWEIRSRYGRAYTDRLLCYTFKMWNTSVTKPANFDIFFWNKLLAGETAIDNDNDTYAGVAEIAKKHEIKIE